MSVLDDAIMTDATGQDAVTELTGIKNALTRNATDIPFSPTASGLSQATVQGAINETARITSYAYDNTATYAKGRYCIHNGGLYKCTTAINTAEEWNSAHWTATTVEAELASTNNSLTNLNLVQASGKISSISGNAYRQGNVVQLYINVTLSSGETSNWITLGTISPAPQIAQRMNVYADTNSTGIKSLRVEVQTTGDIKCFYGDSASFCINVMYIV